MTDLRKRRDLRLLVLALVLFALPAAWLFWTSTEAKARRETTLAGVPTFPAPGQVPPRRPLATPLRPAPPRPQPPAQPANPAAPRPADGMMAFALAPGPSIGLVQVNALFNTPAFERLRECMPAEFRKLEEQTRDLGVDLTRDVDRMAMVPGGAAISGFFEGKKVAEAMLAREGQTLDHREYRGQTIHSNGGRCSAQMGNLVVVSPTGNCEGMIDRALTPPPANAGEEVYGDLYFKTDLSQLRDRGAKNPAELQQLIEALDGMTVRANVWDSVALTMEGAPKSQRDGQDLRALAKGAMGVFKGQLDDDDVELQTLADLAQVSSRKDKLEVNLAMPAQDLFDRLHFPCPGRADAGTP